MKIKQICEICGKEFYVNPSRTKNGRGRFCSHKCQGKWQSKIKKGKSNHICGKCGEENLSWKGGKIIRYCIVCGKKIELHKSDIKRGRGLFCSLKCVGKWNSKQMKGKNNPSWNGGSSFEPYGVKFNNEFKEQIRKRDNYTCQECGHIGGQFDKKLHIHHIDYNKQNNKPENLISLCKSCHSQTNFKRDDWIEYFQDKLRRQDVV